MRGEKTRADGEGSADERAEWEQMRGERESRRE